MPELSSLSPASLTLLGGLVVLVIALGVGRGTNADANLRDGFTKMALSSYDRLTALETRYDDLNGKYEQLMIANTALLNKNNATEVQLSASTQRVTTLEQRVKELETENAALKAEIAELRKQLATGGTA